MAIDRQILLLLDATSPYERKIIQGVATFAYEIGNWDFHFVQDPPGNLPYLDQDPFENPPDLRTWRADGIIAEFLSRKAAAIVNELKVPAIAIEPETGWGNLVAGVPSFTTDNEAIGRLAADEFIERGMKRLAFCGIPRTRLTGWSKLRQEAFEQRAREAGIPCSSFTGERFGHGKQHQLHEELSKWLKLLEKPVGMFACYDVRARHVLSMCRSLGILVPEEIAVIGVDNDELMCELTRPPLSSIEQGARNIGYRAAELLNRLMAGEKAPQLKQVVKPEGIVTRRSSDALTIADEDVAAAVRLIREKACTGIRAYEVVKAVVAARSTFEARFKAVMGRTIHTEIERVRVERAKQLIVATNLPLKQVALETSFAHVQHMTTVFRRHMDQTPGEYRKRSRT